MSDIMKIHDDLSEEVNKSCKKKNQECSESYHDTYSKYGDVTYLTRLKDEFDKISLLMETEDKFVKNDELDNCLIEISNLAILWMSSRYLK